MSSEINKQKTTEWIFLSQLKWPSYASQSFKRTCYRCRKNEACSIILNISVMIPRDSVKSNSKSDIRQIENTNHTSLTVDLLRIEGECSRIKLARLFQEGLFVTLRKNAPISYIEAPTKTNINTFFLSYEGNAGKSVKLYPKLITNDELCWTRSLIVENFSWQHGNIWHNPRWQSDWQEEFLKIFDNIKNLMPSVLKKGFQKIHVAI